MKIDKQIKINLEKKNTLLVTCMIIINLNHYI